MKVPQTFVSDESEKKLEYLLREIRNELKKPFRDSYIMEFNCPYVRVWVGELTQKGSVLLKIENGEITGINCPCYEAVEGEYKCESSKGYCCAMRAWRGKDYK